VLYVSGEESGQQIKLRAERIPDDNPNLFILAETSLTEILHFCDELNPSLLIIDSIQTTYSQGLDSAPGSVGQIRETASVLMQYAKKTGVATVLVGHINKEGAIAGPKVLEHIVDTVLEFEGERNYNYRILRSTKNRFGRAPELGIYEMLETGLREVTNPSELFLSSGNEVLSGVTIGASMQGQRSLLIEVQALVAPSPYPTPQRVSNNYDQKRLAILLAVIEKKCGLKLAQKDVFVNITGGMKMDDPALDLSVLAAVLGSYFDVVVDNKTVFAAEVSLTGELRPVVKVEQRILEAKKLGFKKIYIASHSTNGDLKRFGGIRIEERGRIQDLIGEMFKG